MNRTGTSPVTTRTVVWSPETALACKGLPTSAVFACGVHARLREARRRGMCCAVKQGSCPPEGQLSGHIAATGASRTQQPEA